ncbi:MAG: hypothetical protein ACOYIT_00115 [Christensenellales bacterium]|jgi:hypothetical protein
MIRLISLSLNKRNSKEFDGFGEYSIDHIQLKDDKSLLLSGANIADNSKKIGLNW